MASTQIGGSASEKEKKKRTLQQNKAIHKHCDLASKEAQNSGITYSEFIRLRPKLELPWTPERVKELWQHASLLLYGTTKTSELETHQVSIVYDVVNKVMGEIMGFNILFPSEEEQMLQSL